MEHQVIEIHAAEEDESSNPSYKTHESTSSHSSVASPDPAKPALRSKNVHLIIDAGLMQEVDRVVKAEGEGQQQDQASIKTEPAKAEEGQQQHQAYISPEAARPEEGEQQGQAYIRPDAGKAKETPQQSQASIRAEIAESKEKQKQEELIPKVSMEKFVSEMVGRLEEMPISLIEGNSSPICIFKFPNSLLGISDKSQVPEIVSIGPYHRGEEHLINFEKHKWSFLEKVLDRGRGSKKEVLHRYLEKMRDIEARTKECYANHVVVMSSPDFVEMMLLDGLFVIELFRHLARSEDVITDHDLVFSSWPGSYGDDINDYDLLFTSPGNKGDNNDFNFSSPWLIPILFRDLLKLENQLPLFFLQKLFKLSKTTSDEIDQHFEVMAMKVFELAYPTFNLKHITKDECPKSAKHLLDLFYLNLLPTVSRELDYRPSSRSLQSVTRLRQSGIKFKSSDTYSFLDVKFQNKALQIPKITMNEFILSLIVNCVAWEQCQLKRRSYFNDYVSFMSCLINEPRDVAFLCADGVIGTYSKEDQFVANLFNSLGKNVVFNNRKSHLSTQVTEIEAYYSSNWAYIKRTYFSSPWSFISVAYASLLLIFTMAQVFMAFWSQFRPIPKPVPECQCRAI